MSFLKVNTSQNVLLEFELGNVGQRIFAAVIDLVVAGIYIWIMQNVFSQFLDIDLLKDNPDILLFLIIVFPVILYQPAIEFLWNGRTVGKYLLRLKVLKSDGSSPSLGDYVLRWLIRIIDVKLGFLFIFFIPRYPSSSTHEAFITMILIFMIIPFPLVGILSMVLSQHTQRLGDRVANTVVIRNKRIHSLEDTILIANADNYSPRYLNVLMFTDKDINIIKNVIDEYQKTGDDSHISELSEKARKILGVKDYMVPDFLETILKDYNYLAKNKEKEELLNEVDR